MRLQASSHLHASGSLVELSGPGEEVVLQLTRPGSIRGQVLAGPDLGLDEVQVNLEPDRATHRAQLSWMQQGGQLDDEGRYRFDGLVAGT